MMVCQQQSALLAEDESQEEEEEEAGLCQMFGCAHLGATLMDCARITHPPYPPHLLIPSSHPTTPLHPPINTPPAPQGGEWLGRRLQLPKLRQLRAVRRQQHPHLQLLSA